VKKFRDKGIEPEGYVLYTYAAIQVFAQAAEKAGSTDIEALQKALHENEFDTVLGKLKFDDKGDVTLPGYLFYTWHNGQYDYL
jgi:branched-chain amino acid transport system substrate-binding protein